MKPAVNLQTVLNAALFLYYLLHEERSKRSLSDRYYKPIHSVLKFINISLKVLGRGVYCYFILIKNTQYNSRGIPESRLVKSTHL